MKNLVKKDIPFAVLSLTILCLICSFLPVFRKKENNLAQAETNKMICPLEKEIPVAQGSDQLEYTDKKIILGIQEAVDAATLLLKTANRVSDLSETSCHPENCKSRCQVVDILCQDDDKGCENGDCEPDPGCPSEYDCSGGENRLGGEDITTGSMSRCNGLPDGEITIFDGRTYRIFDWSHYEEHGDYHDADNNGDYGKGECEAPGNCDYDCRRDGNHYVCYEEEEGDCATFVGWCKECQTSDPACQGQACDLATINNYISIGSTAVNIIYDQAIQDVLELYDENDVHWIFQQVVGTLPLLGNICQVPMLGILCNACNIPGIGSIIGSIFGGCLTEPATDIQLFQKAINNVEFCQNNPEDVLKVISGEKEAKWLWRCQDIKGEVLPDCYPDNLYCCQ